MSHTVAVPLTPVPPLVERSCKACGLKFKVLPKSKQKTCSKFCADEIRGVREYSFFRGT